ncbi:hypothetical protein JL720_4800 [Aureococcus anophagefferens]|nr:hypothetical protein JL720_4800 [Aureococcus anophagefferens]
MAPPAAQPSLDEVCSSSAPRAARSGRLRLGRGASPRVPVFFARVRAPRPRARAAAPSRSFARRPDRGAVDGGRAGGELLAALFRTIKHDEAGGERAENVREAVMFALHEVLMKNDAVCAKVADLRDQVETLTDRCTEHFTRHIVKSQASRVIERRLVKSAENLTKLGKEADKLEGERTRPEKRKADEAKAPEPKKPKAESPRRRSSRAQDLLAREAAGDGPPAAAPALTPASIAAPPPEAAKRGPRLEPRSRRRAAAALDAVDRAKAAKPAMNEPGEVEVYVAHLADDEAAAVAMAAVHLAGKATDAPTRLSHVFEAVRSPQGGSMAKRCWPLAAPWRDQVLLAEQRLLRCLNYGVRAEKVKKVLADLCAVMEDERYPTWAGTGAAAGMAPPVLGRDRLQISTSLRGAPVLVANGSLDPNLRAVDGWLSEAGAAYDAGEALGAGVAQILGAKVDLERANDELKAYFTPDLQSNRKDAKADPGPSPRRSRRPRREATVSRLGDGDVARYAARALASAAKAEDCAKLVAAGRDEVANLGKLGAPRRRRGRLRPTTAPHLGAARPRGDGVAAATGGKASKPDKGHVPAKKKPAGRKPSGRKRKAD